MKYTYESFLKELGARLKQMRKDRGWTLRNMVVDHKFHITHWQSFENGKAISVPSLLKVCEVFDTSLEDLVRGLGSSAPDHAASSVKKAVTVPAAPVKRAGRSKKSPSSRPSA
jgi:transcriptional regulator with XRE-family HTH domain